MPAKPAAFTGNMIDDKILTDRVKPAGSDTSSAPAALFLIYRHAQAAFKIMAFFDPGLQ
jgi:hypothetical protein